MARLRNKKKAILQSLDAIVYPVVTVPPEIISEIFLHYVYGQPSGHPSTLTSICRSWRATALSTPGLWNEIRFVGHEFYSDELLDFLEMWLPRTGDLPLDLSITLPSYAPQDAILSSLAQHSARWSVLDLTFTRPLYFPAGSLLAPLSSLKTLKLELRSYTGVFAGPITAFVDAPMLREVSLRSGLDLSRVSLPWTQLTTLELGYQPIFRALEILAQTSSLETLSCGIQGWYTAEVPVQPPITLPHLRLLIDTFRGLRLIGLLTLPALEQLDVREVSRKELHEFLRCLCTTKTLPALKSLRINQREFDMDLRLMTTAFARRWRGVAGTARLRTLRLSADPCFCEAHLTRPFSAAPVVFPEWQGLDIETTNLSNVDNETLRDELARHFCVSHAAAP
ncbi:hypothetical protein B0H15DRAFT_905142 [Mycena belliarum]|uniref:F-box domain-containing protein n=1 Tax=Mycena belliarum TaxID=1033014 RepID=A0AAD6U6W3_9AGAR|nr:hypothetical protein B0H15DRAFT_905142 [Mycena belliae]